MYTLSHELNAHAIIIANAIRIHLAIEIRQFFPCKIKCAVLLFKLPLNTK